MIIRKIFLLIALLGTDSVFAQGLSDYINHIDLTKEQNQRISWNKTKGFGRNYQQSGGDSLNAMVIHD
jgi:hypothetical protein